MNQDGPGDMGRDGHPSNRASTSDPSTPTQSSGALVTDLTRTALTPHLPRCSGPHKTTGSKGRELCPPTAVTPSCSLAPAGFFLCTEHTVPFDIIHLEFFSELWSPFHYWVSQHFCAITCPHLVCFTDKFSPQPPEVTLSET